MRDVLVIGGGAIGLSVAWRLARRGLQVALVERGACGLEASWAAAGILAPGNPNRRGPISALHRESLDIYPAFVVELEAETGVDIGYDRCGRIELCHTDQRHRMGLSEVRAARERTTPDGLPVLEMLTVEQATEREPGVAHHAHGALHCRASARLRNTDLLRALRLACECAGVEIVERCPVMGLVTHGQRVTGVTAPHGPLEARHVVICAGAWSSQLHPVLERLAGVFPSRGEAVLLRADRPPLRRIVKRRHCYLVPRADGHVYVGASDDPEPGFDPRPTAAGTGALLAEARDLVPALAGAIVVGAWAGLRPRTADRRPMIGPVPGLDGLIAAYGHYKTGLVFAPITARIVSDLIIDGRTGYDLERCRPGR